jgi:hypothetical protein
MTTTDQDDDLRAVLHAMAGRIIDAPDLFDKIIAARRRQNRLKTVVAVTVTVGVAASTAALAGFTRSTLPVDHTLSAASPLAAQCPSPANTTKPWNTWRGGTMVDPHPTKVLICAYVYGDHPHIAQRITFTESRAVALAQQINTAPKAPLRMSCLPSGRAEIWILLRGETPTTEIMVSFGCVTGTDGQRVIFLPSITHK